MHNYYFLSTGGLLLIFLLEIYYGYKTDFLMGKEVISKSKVGVKNTERLKTGKVLDLIKT